MNWIGKRVRMLRFKSAPLRSNGSVVGVWYPEPGSQYYIRSVWGGKLDIEVRETPIQGRARNLSRYTIVNVARKDVARWAPGWPMLEAS